MAQRLCFDERTRIEAMRGAELSVDEIAGRLGRHRSTVYRELARGGGRDYCAGRAHRRAGIDAARPKTPKLAGDPVLSEEVADGLKQNWSPHAISADLHARGLPTVCAETIYRACYANHPDSGLKADSWKELPRGRRRRKRRSRCEAAKRSVLGDYVLHLTSRDRS